MNSHKHEMTTSDFTNFHEILYSLYEPTLSDTTLFNYGGWEYSEGKQVLPELSRNVRKEKTPWKEVNTTIITTLKILKNLNRKCQAKCY